MKKRLLLWAAMLLFALVDANAQNGGNGHGQPPQIPIKIKLKGGVEDGTDNLPNGNFLLPVSASYTSDTLFIDVEDYSGGIEVEVVNTLTNQTVLQTFDLIVGGSGTVEVDISALTHGIYRVDIYLPSSSEEYEGYFEIE